MLKQRILTAIFLIPLFIWLLFGASTATFGWVTVVLVFLSGFEWSLLMGVKRFPLRLVYPIVLMGFLYASLWISVQSILLVAFVWWCSAIILIASFPKTQKSWGNSLIVRSLMGILVLVPCWIALNLIRQAEYGSLTLLFLFLLIWSADTGAYFAGRKWGKNPLAPNVSPGKTRQGVYGGMLLSIIVALSTLWLCDFPYRTWSSILLLSLITVVFSIVGDLFESMLKRNVGVKDSGAILPGHGGILDRIDSLTAAAPVFALGALFLTQ